MNRRTNKTASKAQQLLAMKLLLLLFLTSPASAQGTGINEKLRSKDLTVVTQGLAEVATLPFDGHQYWPALINLAAGNQPRQARKARQLLAGFVPKIKSELLSLISAEDATKAKIALRILSRSKDDEVAKKIIEVLDHSEKQRASEATRALYFLASPMTDELMIKRLKSLRTPSDIAADEAARLQKLSDTLYYCAMRELPGAYETLCMAFESQHETLQGYGAQLLRIKHPQRFETTARQALPKAKGDLKNRYLDFIIAIGKTNDRCLGIQSLPEGDIKTFLSEAALRFDSWCGTPKTPLGGAGLRGELEIKNLRSKNSKSIVMTGTDWRAFSTGITTDLPLASLIERPYAFEIELTKAKDGISLNYRPQGPNKVSGYVGVGNRALRTWFGRDEWKLTRATTRFDNEGQIVETKLFDASNRVVEVFRYLSWFRSKNGKLSPKTLDIQTARLRLQTDYQMIAGGAWIFLRAKAAIRQSRPGQGEDLQPLATAEFKLDLPKETPLAPR